MKSITFITGNPKKAEYLSRYLEYPIDHVSLDLDEIQSLDIYAVVEHKVKQAYAKIGKPVIVEDSGIEFCALGKLPGTFTKFFLEELSSELLCSLLDNKDRSAIARCVFAYYDGEKIEFFEGKLNGKITEKPAGNNGFGYDRIFIPEGYDVTRAELNEHDDRITYLRIKPFDKIREFLKNNK